MSEDFVGMMITACRDYPSLYNKVAYLLYKNFQLSGAEITLLCTYMVIMIIKNYPEVIKEVTDGR